MTRLIPLQQGIIYGPVRSKRLGRSLGVNLFPADRKICSFDCVYCHFGPTAEHVSKCVCPDAPSMAEVLAAVEAQLKSDYDFDFVTLSGNGEPTMYPDFDKLVPRMKELIRKYRPQARLALLSNSSTVTDKRLLAALEQIDLPIFKLDAGDQATFEALNQPCPGLQVADIIAGLARLAKKMRVIIQTAMVTGPVPNHKGPAFDQWIAAIKEIQPKEIQLYTTDRPVADARVIKLSDEELEGVAKRVRELTGIKTEAYY